MIRGLIAVLILAASALAQGGMQPGPGTAHSVSGGSFTLVQNPATVFSGSGTTCTVATGSNATSGHLMILSAIFFGGTGFTLTPASNSDTWVTGNAAFSSAWTTQSWYLVVPTTEAMSVTVTSSTGSSSNCVLAEFSGNAASTPLDQVGSQETFISTGTASIATTGNLGQANELAIGIFFESGSNLTTLGAGFTLISRDANPGNVAFQYDILSGGSGAPATCTQSTSSGFDRISQQCLTFKHP